MNDTQPTSSPSSSSNDRFVKIAVAIASLGGMLFGYDTGVISGALLFVKNVFHLSSGMQELVVSAVLIGAVAGAALGGLLASRYGRRKMIILAAIIFTVSALATAFAPNLAVLIAGRIVVGVAIGIASFTTPMYMSEISPVKIRGALVSLNQLAVTVGIVVAYLVDYGLAGAHAWRYMFGLAAVPSAVLAIAMIKMPASPRWLMSRGKADAARPILERIRGTQNVDGEMNEIQESLSKQSGGAKDLFHPTLRMALIVGIGLAVFQQITGINTVIYYAPTIFEFAGFKTAGFSILATAGVGVINVLFTILAIRLMDKVGRRRLLLTGVVGQIIGLAILGVAFQLHQFAGAAVGIVAIISLAVYVGSFAIGLGPIFWLLISEIYPLKVRGTAMSIATIVNWGLNLVVAITFLTLVGVLGESGTFWLYAVIGIATWIFVYKLVPETKGRSLEEIEEHWRKGKHPRELEHAPHRHGLRSII